MNVTDPMLPPVRGLVDRSGRLVEADQRLMDLNIRAGGGIGQPIAIPQIATLTRLAQRLGILVSRGVVAADGDDDVELWVRAEPETRGVRLMITGWRSRSAWHPRVPRWMSEMNAARQRNKAGSASMQPHGKSQSGPRVS
jgi:hypothetical protein